MEYTEKMPMRQTIATYYHNLIVRNIDAQRLFDYFLISAISALLFIRAFLYLTNYPQLGSGRIHIAHIIWGGALMGIAIIIQFFFLSRSSRTVSAVVGGLGFGTFIDELGKFVTRNNNYLFEPTVAMIYLIFILLYITVRIIERRRGALTEKEYVINGLEMMKEVVQDDMDEQEKHNALLFLEKSGDHDLLTTMLIKYLHEVEPTPVPNRPLFAQIRRGLVTRYQSLLHTRWFIGSVIIFFIVKSCIVFVSSALIILDMDDSSRLSFVSLGLSISNLLSVAMVIVAIIIIRHSRRRALQLFRLSVLVTILITQFFLFYRDQFGALFGLLLNIVIYMSLTYMIDEEAISDD